MLGNEKSSLHRENRQGWKWKWLVVALVVGCSTTAAGTATFYIQPAPGRAIRTDAYRQACLYFVLDQKQPDDTTSEIYWLEYNFLSGQFEGEPVSAYDIGRLNTLKLQIRQRTADPTVPDTAPEDLLYPLLEDLHTEPFQRPNNVGDGRIVIPY